MNFPYVPEDDENAQMKYSIYVINDLSFPSVNEGLDPKTGEKFQHITVKPKEPDTTHHFKQV